MIFKEVLHNLSLNTYPRTTEYNYLKAYSPTNITCSVS